MGRCWRGAGICGMDWQPSPVVHAGAVSQELALALGRHVRILPAGRSGSGVVAHLSLAWFCLSILFSRPSWHATGRQLQ